MRYLLDTNILSELLRHPTGRIRRKLDSAPEGSIYTSMLVACEMLFGAKRAGRATLQTDVKRVLASLPVSDVPATAATHYANVAVSLERAGLGIGIFDTMIAAHALADGATVVTANEKHFRRVEGLAVENWMRNA